MFVYVCVYVCVCLYSGQPVSTLGLCAEREERGRERERGSGERGRRKGRMDVFDG